MIGLTVQYHQTMSYQIALYIAKVSQSAHHSSILLQFKVTNTVHQHTSHYLPHMFMFILYALSFPYSLNSRSEVVHRHTLLHNICTTLPALQHSRTLSFQYSTKSKTMVKCTNTHHSTLYATLSTQHNTFSMHHKSNIQINVTRMI